MHRETYPNNTRLPERLPYLVQIHLRRKIMGRTTRANNAIASFVLQLRSPPVLSHIDSAPRNSLKIQDEKVDPVLLALLDAIANRCNDPGVSYYSVKHPSTQQSPHWARCNIQYIRQQMNVIICPRLHVKCWKSHSNMLANL